MVGMKFFTIDRIACFIDSKRISSFHYSIFHGVALTDIFELSYRRPQFEFDHLELSRSGSFIPPVFQTQIHLICNSEIAEKASSWPNVQTVPIKFRKLVNCPLVKGENMTDDGDGILSQLPDDPSLHKELDTYSELVVWRLHDLLPNYDDLADCTVADADGYDCQLQLSPTMLGSYPMIWTGECGTIVSESVFEVLSPNLDRDFFHVSENTL